MRLKILVRTKGISVHIKNTGMRIKQLIRSRFDYGFADPKIFLGFREMGPKTEEMADYCPTAILRS